MSQSKRLALKSQDVLEAVGVWDSTLNDSDDEERVRRWDVAKGNKRLEFEDGIEESFASAKHRLASLKRSVYTGTNETKPSASPVTTVSTATLRRTGAHSASVDSVQTSQDISLRVQQLSERTQALLAAHFADKGTSVGDQSKTLHTTKELRVLHRQAQLLQLGVADELSRRLDGIAAVFTRQERRRQSMVSNREVAGADETLSPGEKEKLRTVCRILTQDIQPATEALLASFHRLSTFQPLHRLAVRNMEELRELTTTTASIQQGLSIGFEQVSRLESELSEGSKTLATNLNELRSRLLALDAK
jgi:hypothetical protein